MPERPPDDGSVLGNLPRARPGRRSDKRAAGASKRKPTAGSTARGGPTASRAAANRAKAKRAGGAAAAKRSASAPRAQASRPAASTSGRSGPDPVGDALRLAGKVAELGLKTAGGIVRRLPGR